LVVRRVIPVPVPVSIGVVVILRSSGALPQVNRTRHKGNGNLECRELLANALLRFVELGSLHHVLHLPASERRVQRVSHLGLDDQLGACNGGAGADQQNTVFIWRHPGNDAL
jgi:hypothetical protein